MKSIIFIAPPAAGKGTHSMLVKEEYNIPSISTGDLLRAARNDNSSIGEEIRKAQDAGLLVADEIVIELLKQRLKQEDCYNGYILDGFPRNIEQAKAYDELLQEINKELGFVIYIDVDKELAKKRTLGRLSCSNCGSVYNDMIDESKPKNNGYCDKCNSALSKRSDDTEETFDIRFDTYIEQTKPLIDYYKDKGVLYTVDGSISKFITFEEIKKILNGGD